MSKIEVQVVDGNNVNLQVTPQARIDLTIDKGAQGPQGPQGIQGPPGPTGATGAGVAAGGTTGQALVKTSNADYATGWVTAVPQATFATSAGSATTATTASSVPYSGLTGTVPTWNQDTTGTASNVTGIVAVANGGTGTSIPSLVAGTNVTISGTWPNQTINSTGGGGGSGTVTNIATGPGLSGGPITTTGTIDLAAAYGDTVNPYASKTANFVLAAPNGATGVPTFRALVAADVPTLNQNTTGTAANVSGTVAIANGGTGQTTANAAFNALAPSQASQSGKYLTTDGTNTSWASSPSGTVTSVGGTGNVSGISLSGTVTSSGNLTLGGALDLSSPPDIGFTTPAAGTFTTLVTTGQTSLGGVAGSETARFIAANVSDVWVEFGNSGTTSTVYAQGTVGNRTLALASRGTTGFISFRTNGGAQEQARISHTASAVNYVQVTGAATGSAPTISAQGSDTNAGMVIRAKGTGVLYLETVGAADVRFQPRGIRSFSVNGVTSGVNFGYVTGSVASAAPIFGVDGTDTNIDLTLTPKGTGRVNITTSIKPKVNSEATVASPLAWNSTSFDEYAINSLANNLTINADANASPADGQFMIFRIRSDATPRSLTWTTGSANSFRAVGITLPATTVVTGGIPKIVYVGCVYNAADSRWDAIAVSQEV